MNQPQQQVREKHRGDLPQRRAHGPAGDGGNGGQRGKERLGKGVHLLHDRSPRPHQAVQTACRQSGDGQPPRHRQKPALVSHTLLKAADQSA